MHIGTLPQSFVGSTVDEVNEHSDSHENRMFEKSRDVYGSECDSEARPVGEDSSDHEDEV